MTMLGDEVLASGGKPELLTSLETWNGTTWVERVDHLVLGRVYHAAVSIQAGVISRH